MRRSLERSRVRPRSGERSYEARSYGARSYGAGNYGGGRLAAGLVDVCQQMGGPRRTWRARRAGISLVEVLISIFILLFGLIGIASMFPAGAFHVRKAQRYDSAAAVGQAAFNDLQIRGLLRPADEYTIAPPSSAPVELPIQFDPLGSDSRVLVGHKKVLLPGTGADAAGDVVFQSRDDLKISQPDDADEPATQASDPYRTFEGHYSWMFTVAPFTGDQFVVSVVVFQSRFVDNEVTANCTTQGGYGGGLVTITSGHGTPEQMRPGNWVMLANTSNNFYRWYRIITANRNGSNWELTVTGPDWTGQSPNRVELFESAVSVYEKIMRLDNDSLWSWQ